MRIIYRLIIALLLLFLSTFLIIRIPGVQTYIAGKITSYVDQKTGFKSEITFVSVKWFDEIIVEGVSLYDEQDSLMLAVERLDADLDIAALINDKNIVLNSATVENGKFHLIKHTSSPAINISTFLQGLGSGGSGGSQQAAGVRIGSINLAGVDVRYDNYDKPPVDIAIDPSHIHLRRITGQLSGFDLLGDSLSIAINSFSCEVNGGLLQLKKLEGALEMYSGRVALNQLELQTGLSSVEGDLAVTYDSVADFQKPISELDLDFVIRKGELAASELALFTNIPNQIKKDVIAVSGKFTGPIDRLRGDNVQLGMGGYLRFNADLFVSGLPAIQETFLDVEFKQSYIELNTFFKVFGNRPVSVPSKLSKLNYQGEFLGFFSDFVANGFFRTDAGDLRTDINLKINEYPNTTFYKGFVSTDRFELGEVFGDTTLLQEIAMEGSIEGVGLTIDQADFFLKSKIDRVGVNGYQYSNIVTDGEFKSRFFDGKLTVEDPNLNLAVNGKIDLSDGREEIKALITVDSTNLKTLNLTSENYIVSAVTDVEMSGFDIDQTNGIVKLTNFSIDNEGRRLAIDDAVLDMKIVNDDRIITLESDQLKANVSGDFKISELIPDVSTLYREIYLKLNNQEDTLYSFYQQQSADASRAYSLQFSLDVEDPNDFVSPFVKDLHVSDHLSVYGGYTQALGRDLSLHLTVDSVQFKGRALTDAYVQLGFAKSSPTAIMTSQLAIYSNNQYWTKRVSTQALESVWSWEGENIDFRVAANPPDSANALDVKGRISFAPDTTMMRLDASMVKLDNHQFRFNDTHSLTYVQGEGARLFTAENLVLSDGTQSLSLEGLWNLGRDTELGFTLRKLDMVNLSALVGRDLDGKANGEVSFNQKNGNSFFTGDLTIDQLRVDDFLVGQMEASANWDKADQQVKVDFKINREGVRSIDVTGGITFADEEQQLDFIADFDGAKIVLLEPYLEGVVSGLDGEVTGELNIGGTLEYPVVTGDASLQNGKAMVDYLKTEYVYSGDLTFVQDEILLKNITLSDVIGNNAFAKGKISHNGFRDLLIDVNADLRNFNVLNTNSKDNQLFYGEAYATGTVGLFGTPQNIKISANATTNKNTRIFVPLSESSSTEVKEYITFVDFSDTVSVAADESAQKDLKGLELDFTLDVTPDAYFELIFDISSGDIIRGRGEGDIKLTVNTEGDFSMFGDYEITEGGYNFTLYNIINKEFKINKGSKIQWFGDPYKALLDIEATYGQLVSLAPIINQDGPSIRSNALVQLFLDGEMLSPDINFDIDFEDYPLEYAIFIEAFKSSIRADQQELNRQVFSLLILKRLFEGDAFVASEAIGVSVSEFVSNQLSYWITQVDENLEIDVDFSNLDEDAFNTFQLRLSYKFLDGRLRITRGGGIGTVEGDVDDNRLGSIIGDLTLEYLLTPDGRLRVKMFTRNNRNAFDDSYTFDTGASLRYVRSFDYLKEIWRKNKVKKTRFVKDNGEEVKQQ